MSNYRKFKDEQPEAGRLVELKTMTKTDLPYAVGQPMAAYINNSVIESFVYTTLVWENGVPKWSHKGFGSGPLLPTDEWRYSEVKEPNSPLCNSEQQAVASNVSMLADLPKVNFKVENGLLVGENSDGGWCVGIPVNEAYDALLDYSRIVAISSQSPAYHSISVSNNLHPLPKDYADNIGIKVSTPAPSNMPWKSWGQELETRDLRIKELEERNKRQQEVIEVQVEELTNYRAALKAKEEEREAFLKVLATKDAKITDLMVQNATLKARLNPNAEA